MTALLVDAVTSVERTKAEPKRRTEARQSAWEEGFAALKKFRAREGHCNVPYCHVEGATRFRLGHWVKTQRQDKHLAPDRRRLLNAIEFVWDAQRRAWEEGFVLLMKFKAKEGHCRVPRGHIEGLLGFRLGRWVAEQRSKKDTMAADRRRLLNAIKFVWDAPESRWEDGFAALERYKARVGHCRVPNPYIERGWGFRLGIWVSTQRRQKNSMAAWRRRRLDALGFVWNAFANKWEEGFAAITRYKARVGHCRVPQSRVEDKTGFKLGAWVNQQRTKKVTMAADRRRRLNKIGFVWNVYSHA